MNISIENKVFHLYKENDTVEVTVNYAVFLNICCRWIELEMQKCSPKRLGQIILLTRIIIEFSLETARLVAKISSENQQPFMRIFSVDAPKSLSKYLNLPVLRNALEE